MNYGNITGILFAITGITIIAMAVIEGKKSKSHKEAL